MKAQFAHKEVWTSHSYAVQIKYRLDWYLVDNRKITRQMQGAAWGRELQERKGRPGSVIREYQDLSPLSLCLLDRIFYLISSSESSRFFSWLTFCSVISHRIFPWDESHRVSEIPRSWLWTDLRLRGERDPWQVLWLGEIHERVAVSQAVVSR